MGVGHFKRKFQVEGDIAGVRKLKRLPFHVISKYRRYIFRFVTKHACDRQTDGRADGRTDRQNYYPQDRASIAASRGKKQIQKFPPYHKYVAIPFEMQTFENGTRYVKIAIKS